MSFSEPFSGYFADFGETVTWSGGSFDAIFDLPTLMTADQTSASKYVSDTLAQAPILTAVADDIGALAAGDTVTLRSVNYTVRTVEPDGTGMVLITMTTP